MNKDRETIAEVRERPILFSGGMVRAILDGQKTVTRRAMKPQPPAPMVRFEAWRLHGIQQYRAGNGKSERYFEEGDTMPPNALPLWVGFESDGTTRQWRCPYGSPGDRLYVRETWCQLDRDGWWNPSEPRDWMYNLGGKHGPRRNGVAYRAECDEESERVRVELGYRWRPPIYMPKWASRITLEITDVRAERVQAISEEDAIAEGCSPGGGISSGPMDPVEYDGYSAAQDFAALWDSINGKRPGCSWESNCWVWVISFKRIMAA